MQATVRTVTVVAGENNDPEATDKAALAQTVERMDLKMISQNVWVTKVIGMSEDSQKNVLAPTYKFVSFRHDADPRAAGTAMDFNNAPTFEGRKKKS